MFFLYLKNSSTLGLYLFVSFLALWIWSAGLSPSTCHRWETHGGHSCALSRCPWGWQSPVASLGDPCRTSTSLPVNPLFILVLLSVFHPHRRQFPRSTPSSAPFRNLLLAVSLSISSSHTASPFLRLPCIRIAMETGSCSSLQLLLSLHPVRDSLSSCSVFTLSCYNQCFLCLVAKVKLHICERFTFIGSWN